MRFEKWHGLGNDFILIEHPVSAEDAAALCERHRGVGGDGVLHIDASKPAMVVLNADGSRPEMCGNGLRCVAGWLAARNDRVREVDIHTDAGVRSCRVERIADGIYEVSADMGEARVTGELRHEGRRFVLVDVGNPHAVCFDELDLGEADRLGPAVEAHVKGGVNVELVSPRPGGGLDVRVFERGVGWTDACGTGACAVAAAAVAERICPAGTTIDVHLPGGPLAIEVTGERVRMTGPAERVFVGEVALSETRQ
jgi:diaminopimelate epimerase